MKILKKLLVGFIALIAVLLIIALFVPKQYTVSVSETINKPKQQVYDYVKTLRNQTQYSEWVKADPNLNPEIIGTDGTVGAIQRWDSKNDNIGEDVGQGEQEIKNMTEDRIDLELRFKRPFESKANAANIFKAISENSTLITSEFYAKDVYPFNLMSYTFGQSIIKKTQIQNLKNIKQILESQ
ncbi:MAG: SRPBCC family protein [Saprospiraceae bacterium]|nr:SRPBCC family protein [Saprospiraceae bacterium]